jgi:hypothetical protein
MNEELSIVKVGGGLFVGLLFCFLLSVACLLQFDSFKKTGSTRGQGRSCFLFFWTYYLVP